MASPLITTVPFTAQNITIANEVASYTIPASGQYQFQCKLTGLDPDAANLTPCLNRYDADTNWIGCVGDPNRMISKANADDTAECFAFASFFAVAEESVALSLLSSNAADTAVGGGLEVWDATAANVTAVNGTAFAGATVPLPDSGSMPLPDVLLLAAAVYGLNVSGAAAQYLYCTGIDAHGHLTFSSVQPGQVGPGGSSTLTANSAGTLWTLTETGGSAGPWTNATLFGQYNDGGSPPTSCGVTIAPPALQRFQPTTQPQVDEDGYTLARDETDAALLSQSYATTTGVKASNLPGDYFNNTEQSELAAAAAIAPPSAAAIATAVAADILETPANKLATDTSGDVELVSAEQSELAAAAAISPPSAATIAAQTAAAILETPANKLATDSSGDVTLISAEQAELAKSGTAIIAPAVGVAPAKLQGVELPDAALYGAYATTIAVVDQLDNPIALTGKTLEMQFFNMQLPTVAAFTLKSGGAAGNCLAVNVGGTNQLDVAIAPANLAAPGALRWILWDTTANGAPLRLLEGTLVVGTNPQP